MNKTVGSIMFLVMCVACFLVTAYLRTLDFSPGILFMSLLVLIVLNTLGLAAWEEAYLARKVSVDSNRWASFEAMKSESSERDRREA